MLITQHVATLHQYLKYKPLPDAYPGAITRHGLFESSLPTATV